MPTELATSDSAKAFFAQLIDTGRLRSLYDFQTGMGFFDRIGHARFKFSLVSLSEARDAENPVFRVAFFLRTQDEIGRPIRYFQMSKKDIEIINPNTRTAPVFRSKSDAALTKQIYERVPVLVNETIDAGNPWGVEFRQGLFNMTSDSELFRTARQLCNEGFTRNGSDWVASNSGQRLVPLQEAKMVHHFNHRWATYEDELGDDKARDTTEVELVNPAFEVVPRYWVPEGEVISRLAQKGWKRRWLIGWRDITNATNERTVIACSFPWSGIGNNLPLIFVNAKYQTAHSACLLACLSSLTLDFVARNKVGGTHINFFIAEQLPVLPPSAFEHTDLTYIVTRVLELTYTSHTMKPFADDLGYEGSSPFVWEERRRTLLRAELDAKIAQLYGLTRDQLRYILDPADIYGPTYPSETFRGLKKNEIAKYGEYRTARLVLDAWDRIERGELK